MKALTNYKHIGHFIIFVVILFSCQQNGELSDAYGNFEATEVIISAEGNGKLMTFELEEGEKLTKGKAVGYQDTIPLYLKKMQLEASIAAIKTKMQDIPSQLNVYLEKEKNLQRELNRMQSLLKEDAATQKQVDDLDGELKFVRKQLHAVNATLTTANKGLLSEIQPLNYQILQIEDQIEKAIITAPIDGTVLTKYKEPNELSAFGQPLFKMADLKRITLKVYIDALQLSAIKLGQKATVKVDISDGSLKEYSGKICWISGEAEFTPKSIQTRKERVNLVYAIKIEVENDGMLKIGMPAEVNF